MPQIPEKIHELTVGQLSARSGAAVSALHFYESKGLISSRRTSGAVGSAMARNAGGSRASSACAIAGASASPGGTIAARTETNQ